MAVGNKPGGRKGAGGRRGGGTAGASVPGLVCVCWGGGRAPSDPERSCGGAVGAHSVPPESQGCWAPTARCRGYTLLARPRGESLRGGSRAVAALHPPSGAGCSLGLLRPLHPKPGRQRPLRGVLGTAPAGPAGHEQVRAAGLTLRAGAGGQAALPVRPGSSGEPTACSRADCPRPPAQGASPAAPPPSQGPGQSAGAWSPGPLPSAGCMWALGGRGAGGFVSPGRGAPARGSEQ